MHKSNKMNKLNKRWLLLVLAWFSLGVFAQAPDWVNPAQRKLQYGEEEYLVGFASENNTRKENPDELLKRLEIYAKGQIAEYIQVTVRSETMLLKKEEGGQLQQSFSSIGHSAANLVLSGLKTENYYDHQQKIGYSFVYARRGDLLAWYLGELNAKIAESERLIGQTGSLLSSNVEQAFKYALDALQLVSQIEQAQSVIIVLKRTDFEKDIQIDRVVKLKTDIDNAMQEANRGSANTLDDACFFIARGLKVKTGAINSPVRVSAFTFQDTRMGSELSSRIHQSLTSRLVSTAGFNVIPAGPAAEGYLLTGTYWKDAGQIKLIATLREDNGRIAATAEAILSMDWITANTIRYLPENFEDAYARMRIFDKDEIIKGDLNVEIWTNKGDDNLIFNEGERLRFYVRASKECYIRFIYHLANNQSVLLLDNHYIAAGMANKVVEIPGEFECAEPFGVETLQVNAQTKPFDPLRITSQDGYDYISETLHQVVAATRGIKKVTPDIVEKAEKRIVFTTLKE